MNLVQRMVAENLQSVTSQEIADASGLYNSDLCNWIIAHKEHFEKYGPMRGKDGTVVLNTRQAMLACCMLPSLSNTDKAWELSEVAESLMITNLKARQNERLN